MSLNLQLNNNQKKNDKNVFGDMLIFLRLERWGTWMCAHTQRERVRESDTHTHRRKSWSCTSPEMQSNKSTCNGLLLLSHGRTIKPFVTKWDRLVTGAIEKRSCCSAFCPAEFNSNPDKPSPACSTSDPEDPDWLVQVCLIKIGAKLYRTAALQNRWCLTLDYRMTH